MHRTSIDVFDSIKAPSKEFYELVLADLNLVRLNL